MICRPIFPSSPGEPLAARRWSPLLPTLEAEEGGRRERERRRRRRSRVTGETERRARDTKEAETQRQERIRLVKGDKRQREREGSRIQSSSMLPLS